MARIILTVLFSTLWFNILGQTVRGKVLDGDSSEPIPYANVFLNNTMMGTATDERGEFQFRGKAGFYQLVVSVIGYEKHIQEVTLEQDSDITLTINLTTLPQELNEVVVKPDTAGWKYNYATFFKTLIGESSNASDCEIENPKVIDFDYNPGKNVLEAYAWEPLQIVNKALGYRIEYHLEEFRIDFKNRSAFFYGLPRMAELNGGKRKQRKWEEERKKAYHGSMLELGRLLYSEASLEDHGWRANKITRIPNPDRPSEDFINRKIRTHGLNDDGTYDLDNDSVRYYRSLKKLPEYTDHLTRQPFDFSQVLTSHDPFKVLAYQGGIQFVYTKEYQEEAYYRLFSKESGKKLPQSTIVWFLADKYLIYENGYIVNVSDYLLEGYMGWSEKVCDMLPLEYKPEEYDN